MGNTRRRTRIAGAIVALGTASVAIAGSAPASNSDTPPPRALRILVTNDDGIAADGLDAVVESLRVLPNVEGTVVAPATNPIGTGDAITTDPIAVTT